MNLTEGLAALFLGLSILVILINSITFYRYLDGRCRLLPAMVLAILGGLLWGVFTYLDDGNLIATIIMGVGGFFFNILGPLVGGIFATLMLGR